MGKNSEKRNRAAAAEIEAPAPAAVISPEMIAALIAAGWKAPKQTKAPAEKRTSALDAAALILADSAEPMGARAMIAEMAKRKLWESPGGATPDATLAAAIVREIAAKGDTSRFIKVAPGAWISRARRAAASSAAEAAAQ